MRAEAPSGERARIARTLVGGRGHAPSLVVSLSSVKVVRHNAEIDPVENGGRDPSTAVYRGIGSAPSILRLT